MKQNILYVHGYGSNPQESSTLKNLQIMLGDRYNIVGVEYSQTNPEKGFEQIKSRIKEVSPILVIGSSLGGFFTLLLGSAHHKVVINPCMMPAAELPKIGFIDANIVYADLQEQLLNSDIEGEDRLTTTGFFGTHDELLNYQTLFRKMYYKDGILFNAGHTPSMDELRAIIPDILSYINGFDEIDRFFSNNLAVPD